MRTGSLTTERWSRKSVLFGALMLCALVFPAADAHAQRTTGTAPAPIEYEQLTPANGWTCTNDLRTSCKHSDGRTAACVSIPTGDTMVSGCEVTTPDGGRTSTVDNGIQQQTTAVDSTGQTTGTSNQKSPQAGCMPDIGKCFVDALAGGMSIVGGAIAFVVLIIASFILWIVGGLFNWVVIKTVFEFGSTFGTSDGMLIAWGIMRDIGNIILLFSFIFMGLATILNTHAVDEFSARKALPNLIIFAVLLNFSLFASQVVIDVSNSFASVFTYQAGINCTEDTDEVTVDSKTGDITYADECANVGISGKVLEMAGIASVWRTTDFGTFMGNPTAHAPVYIGLALFVTITAVVLLAAAIMLVFRAVMLCLLMVVSPIGFAGMAIPPLHKYARDWWKKLLDNAFFAPIYLLLVLISLKIVEGLVGDNKGGSFADALINGGSNAPQIFVIFAVVIGFMVMSLMVAKSMGAVGANFAVGNSTKLIGGATLGTVGFIGRRTLGNASLAASTAIRRNRYLTEKNPGLGRLLAGVTDKGASSSYSVRGFASKAVAGAGLDFGKASKDVAHGIHGIEKKAVDQRIAFAKTFNGRAEEDSDRRERLKKAKVEQGKAAETVAEQLATENAVKIQQQKAEADTDKQAQIVEQLRQQAANAVKTTGAPDTAIEARLAAEEEKLKQQKTRLVTADANLAGATARLAEARENEATAAAAAADTSYKTITKEEQQKRYAEGMEGKKHTGKGIGINVIRRDGVTEKWFTPTLASHANHEAAAKIRKNAGRTDMEKALDTIKEKYEQQAESANHGADAANDNGHGNANDNKKGGDSHAAAH